MADVRVTVGRRPRDSGSTVGVQVNTFGLQKLIDAVDGEAIAQVLMDTMQPIRDEAYQNWPKPPGQDGNYVRTGASADSIMVFTSEVGEHSARVILQAGGQKLKDDPRNPRGKDYAPFVEFGINSNAGVGVLRDAVYDNDGTIRQGIHDGIARLVKDALA